MTDRTTIEAAMRRALDLASRGPATGVNPQVGCVLLDETGAIVAEGWHRGVGTPHAEVDALSHLARRPSTGSGNEGGSGDESGSGNGPSTGSGNDIPDARGLTAVVTLEPCNHHGHTGPCSLALIEAGISEVFYAVSDPSPIAGGGAERLANAGVAVTGGVLSAEAEEFQHAWLTATRNQRPFVTVKWASTLDGRAAAADGSSQWITGTTARQRVHEQREASDAILVGTGTVLADDPSLTARGDAGELLDHQPVAVVVGERRVPDAARVRHHPAGFIETGSRDLVAILADLYDRGIRRVYVEGGPTLASAIIAADLADEFAIYLAPKLLGGDRLAIGDLGIPSMAGIRTLHLTSVEQLGNDLLITARPMAPKGTERVTADSTPSVSSTSSTPSTTESRI